MIALGVILFVLLVNLFVGIPKLAQGSSTVTPVERLEALATKHLEAADRAYSKGRPGLAEGHLDLYARLTQELEDRGLQRRKELN